MISRVQLPSIETLAKILLESSVWYFWWDEQMEYIDTALEHFRSLNPKQFSFLQKLTLAQEAVENAGIVVSLEMWLDHEGYDPHLLHISCSGIQQLRIAPDTNYIKIRLEITSMREAQWESLRYCVKAEDNQLAFYCQSLEVEVLEGFENEEEQ